MQHTRLSDYNPGRDIYIKIQYNGFTEREV
jgi:hypothetical protein